MLSGNRLNNFADEFKAGIEAASARNGRPAITSSLTGALFLKSGGITCRSAVQKLRAGQPLNDVHLEALDNLGEILEQIGRKGLET